MSDNSAVLAAARSPAVVAVYIDETEDETVPQVGAASRWWLHYSLQDLDRQLQALGSRLLLRRGVPSEVLLGLAQETGAEEIHWSRRYDPLLDARDLATQAVLSQHGIVVHSHKGALLYEPGEILSGTGNRYQVFSGFWKACQRQGLPNEVLPRPAEEPFQRHFTITALDLDDLNYAPRIPWDIGFQGWNPGEEGARMVLQTFLRGPATNYLSNRDFPGLAGTARLSAHLHYGEISPRQVVAMTLERLSTVVGTEDQQSLMSFLRQLVWREFSYHVFQAFPQMSCQAIDERFDRFPWATKYALPLEKWQRGLTGVPLVDAGMRELWTTGWMHNRVRMIVASFLTKNLLIPWQEGARWFLNTLVDADRAVNSFNWQWVAGCGLDASPYFRIFNPVIQAQRFDPRGQYIRRWIPELKQLSNRSIAEPWNCDDEQLNRASVRLGIDYPRPIVDLKATRKRALEAYRATRGA